MILARKFQHVLDVALDRVERHVGAAAAVRAQEAGGKVQARHAAAFADGA